MLCGILVMAGGFSSCNTTGCTENHNSIPLAGFYSMLTKKAVSVNNLEISGEGAPGDSILYPRSQQLSEVYLPLRSKQNVTSYFFKFYDSEGNVGASDKVTFRYDSHAWFASEECGAMYRYRITELTHTSSVIDSIAITDSLITNIDTVRIRIYLHEDPAEEDGGEDE